MSTAVSAQDKIAADTAKFLDSHIPLELLEYSTDDFHFSREMDRLMLYSDFLKDSSLVWLRTRMMLAEFNNESNMFANTAAKTLNPLHDKYLESQKLSTFKYILGSVQVGAVGYLAYKHLKKYSFLKKK